MFFLLLFDAFVNIKKKVIFFHLVLPPSCVEQASYKKQLKITIFIWSHYQLYGFRQCERVDKAKTNKQNVKQNLYVGMNYVHRPLTCNSETVPVCVLCAPTNMWNQQARYALLHASNCVSFFLEEQDNKINRDNQSLFAIEFIHIYGFYHALSLLLH